MTFAELDAWTIVPGILVGGLVTTTIILYCIVKLLDEEKWP